MDGADYIDPVPPQDVLRSREETSRLRSQGLLIKTGRGKRIDYVVDNYGDPLSTLQVAVLERLPGKVNQQLIRSIFEIRSLNADVAATFYQGFIRQIIDPNVVLLEAIRISLSPQAMFTNDDGEIADKRNYIRLVALALRFGADPNQYVDVDTPEKVHILFYTQRFGIDLREQYGTDSIIDDEIYKSLVMYYLVLSGANYDRKVIEVDVERESVVQALEKYPDALKSVLYNMELDISDPPEAFTVPYLDPNTANDLSILLSQRLTKIQQVYQNRDNPIILKQKYPDEWTDEELLDIFYNMDYRRIANSIPQEEIPDQLREASICYSHRTYVALIRRLDPKLIPVIGTEELNVCARFLDTNGVDTLLLVGAVPSYVLKDKILERMARAKGKLPLTLDMNGKMLWYFTRYGYSLDEPQMLLLRRIAPYIADELKIYMEKNPAWKAECNVETTEPSDNLREVARDAGLNPNGNKRDICRGLATITSVSSADAIRVAEELNERKLRVGSETLDEAIRDDKIEKRLKKVEEDNKRLEKLKSRMNNTNTNKTVNSSAVISSLSNLKEEEVEEETDARSSRTVITNSKSPKSSSQLKSEKKSSSSTMQKSPKTTVKIGGLGLKNSNGVIDVKSSPTKVNKVNPDVIRQISNSNISVPSQKKTLRKPRLSGENGGELQYRKTKDKIKGNCKKNGDCKIEIEEETEELSIKEPKEEKRVVIKSPPVVTKKQAPVKPRKATPYPQEVPPPTPSKLKPDTSVQLRNSNNRGPFTRVNTSSKDTELRKVLDANREDNINEALTSHSSRNTGDICENQDTLQYNPRDYNELDITEYDDGKAKKPWCFESRDYKSLLETKFNPFTGEKIPTDTLETMRTKLKLLENARLKKNQKPIPRGIKDLRGGGYQGDADAQIALRTLEQLYLYYGLAPEIFREDYTIADMQFILDQLYSDAPTLDVTSRQHSMRTFAVVIVNDIYIGGEQDVERADEIFGLIYDYGNPVAEGVEASPEELGES